MPSSLLPTGVYTGPAQRGVLSPSLKPVSGRCWSAWGCGHLAPLLLTRNTIQESYCRGLKKVDTDCMYYFTSNFISPWGEGPHSTMLPFLDPAAPGSNPSIPEIFLVEKIVERG